MPKTRRVRSAKAQEGRLAEIVSKYVEQLVAAVGQEVRRSVAAEVQAFLSSAQRGEGKGLARRARKPVKRRVLPCIAPNCENPSKGPRFHYLCDKHRDAPKKQYEAWRAAKLEKQAA